VAWPAQRSASHNVGVTRNQKSCRWHLAFQMPNSLRFVSTGRIGVELIASGGHMIRKITAVLCFLSLSVATSDLSGQEEASQRSYLSELLDIVNGTGRRISAVCGLRYDDLILSKRPYGAVRWRADTDKTGRETTVPISPSVRTAIDRVLAERPGVGGAYLFPSPTDASKPIRRHLAADWLRRAEELAELPRLVGGQFHSYRRNRVTERKHLPDVDVAAAGGWTELSSLKKAYQQADESTMLQVVFQVGELRERQA